MVPRSAFAAAVVAELNAHTGIHRVIPVEGRNARCHDERKERHGGFQNDPEIRFGFG
jgi:hypothetical protein